MRKVNVEHHREQKHRDEEECTNKGGVNHGSHAWSGSGLRKIERDGGQKEATEQFGLVLAPSFVTFREDDGYRQSDNQRERQGHSTLDVIGRTRHTNAELHSRDNVGLPTRRGARVSRHRSMRTTNQPAGDATIHVSRALDRPQDPMLVRACGSEPDREYLLIERIPSQIRFECELAPHDRIERVRIEARVMI
jgi:hypothetical protein